MAKSICREFGVDPYWLETGEGEMFIQSDDAFMKKLDQIMAGENDFHKNIIRMAANLDTEAVSYTHLTSLTLIYMLFFDFNSPPLPYPKGIGSGLPTPYPHISS